MGIEHAIDEVGLSVVAERMKTSPQRVNNWKARGVPLDQVIDFCRSVNWKVTPHEIYPRNYPHPEDGLPEEVRKAA